MTQLQQQLARFERYSGGILGVSARHLPSMRRIEYHADHPFLLCSTYKIPIAWCLLQKATQQAHNLSDLYDIAAYDLRPGMTSTLNQLNYASPVKMSLLNLMQFMLQESCNTATDYILRLLGGPTAVMADLKQAGIDNLRVDSTTLEAIAAWDGIEQLPADQRCTLQQYQNLAAQVSPEKLQQARARLQDDVADRGTPAAMTQLLMKLYTHEVVTPEHAALLFKIMRRCKTGSQRILGLLPPNTVVSHKTGTLSGHTNDTGILYLPKDAGVIALTVFVEHPTKSTKIGERVIAEVARTVYDALLLTK